MAKKLFELERELTALREEYHEISQTATAPDLAAKSDVIKAKMQEIGSVLVKGANPCGECGQVPIGVKRRPGVFEIGCPACTNPESLSVPADNLRSQGETVEEAADNWNNCIYWLKPVAASPIEG